MSTSSAWHWADFRCRDPDAVDRLLGGLEGSGCIGTEEMEEGASIRVRAYWPWSVASDAVRAMAETAGVQAGTEALGVGIQAEEDWLALWKRFFTPLHVSSRFWVCPPWDVCRPPAGEEVLVIEPQMAFGTGHHATTQLCIELLEEQVRPNCTVLDVGTGSGILAIAAAKLGAGQVVAVESDPDAVANARENLERNAVVGQVRVVEGAFPGNPLPPADVSVCNVITARLLPLLKPLACATRPAGVVIVSGVGTEHRDECVGVAREAGLGLESERHKEDWCAFVFALEAQIPHEEST